MTAGSPREPRPLRRPQAREMQAQGPTAMKERRGAFHEKHRDVEPGNGGRLLRWTRWEPRLAGPVSPAMRTMAITLNEATKLVFSRTLKESQVEELSPAPRARPARALSPEGTTRRGHHGFGSGSLVSQLTQHGLIDEYQFVVMPVLIGNGLNLLTGLSDSVRVDLLEAKKYPSGRILLRYGRPT
jgi:dihydrofolate reductase